jgi:two-component sensor histidine kinase
LIGCNWPDFWNDPGKSDALRCIAQAKLGHSTSFQGFTATFAGNVRFWDVRVTPMLDHEGRPERILAVSRDHTYLKQLEQERDYLTQELAHRLKNAFAMVQSVMSQTLRQAKSLTEGREVLSGRIQALAAAQNILTDQSSSDMKLTEVVNAALLPHRTGEGRFDISGGDARISGQQGLGLSLALHELATNARKYGALSNNVGKVLIRWQIAPDGGFEFIWTETGGPPVAPPVQTGFGSMLIEKIVATYFEGSAQLSYPVEGVQFNLSGMIQPNYRSLQE